MPALAAAEANRLLDASLGVAAYTEPTGPMRAALCTNTGTAATPGTEVANAGGSTYARQAVTFGAAAGQAASNSGAVTFTNMPAVTVQSLELFDSAGTPRRAYYGALTVARTLNLGDSLTFPAGSIAATLA